MRRRLEAVEREHAHLVTELSAANKRLATVNKELQDANEELQAANEELMLTQEELQATNEEFEATNEELQATNEELETNNEELQATNEELQTTNDELTARTAELQELTQQHRIEQLQLSSVLERFPHYCNGIECRRPHHPRSESRLSGNARSSQCLQCSADRGFYRQGHGRIDERLDPRSKQCGTINTAPIAASMAANTTDSRRFVHTIVPISDASGTTISRLFVYSEGVE